MNQITDPDEISYKQARRRLGRIAPIPLIFDVIIAMAIWLFRGEIFKEPQADFLATLIAIGLIASGVFSYFILKAMEKRVVMGQSNKETQKDLKD